MLRRVEWFPVFPCVANVAEAKKQAYIEQAASLGAIPRSELACCFADQLLGKASS